MPEKTCIFLPYSVSSWRPMAHVSMLPLAFVQLNHHGPTITQIYTAGGSVFAPAVSKIAFVHSINITSSVHIGCET